MFRLKIPEGVLSQGSAPYDVHLEIRLAGEDILAAITGGTRPHIGAVCLAEPSGAAHPVTGESAVAGAGQSLKLQTMAAPGHKDAVLAEMFAAALCKEYGVRVCAAAGVHVDDASGEEIALMVKNAKELLEKVLENLSC